MSEEFIFNWKMVIFPLAALLYFQVLTYLDRQYFSKKPLTTEEYLAWLARTNECSEYDLFFVSAEEWNVPKQNIEEDFKKYLQDYVVPYYVEDFVRKARKELNLK